MALTVKHFQLMEADYGMAKKLRYLLAHLYGFDVEVSCRDFLVQAGEAEQDTWVAIQKAFAQTKGANIRLQQLAEKANLEYQVEQAYEAGRVCAQELLPAQLIARGMELRYSKNPYWQKADVPEQVQQAWSDGFQEYLELTREESW
ncbi:hypothetical protein [Thiosulfativibrio zosterae]|uniref:Uncharacterized protein n=1 Tax=Thiosulfativibrio zosterae TaxID=2675053 RepID=A0A6F8PM50_9GAMM|nr:hypothetical protein [Thiosulfativibrio zosterae]BBP43165.1 hypothetical protein THMIRHAT_09110 [Thiosulfativibrio zosterae]